MTVDALRKIFIAVLVASLGGFSAVAVTACDDDESEQVELSLTERDLSPGRVEVSAGEIEFVVKNDGKRRHVFAVETPDGIERTDDIEPGEEGRLTVTLPDGRYRMYDPRGDYRARGVRGTVIVSADVTDTVTERTVTERTVEEDTAEPSAPEDVDEPPVTVTEREVQPAPRPSPRRPPPTPTPPRTVPEETPVEPTPPPTSP